MSKAQEFRVDECRVGYILRGRPLKLFKEKSLPEEDPIHADCILPNGHIIGFTYAEDSFYEANALAQRKLKRLEGEITLNEEHYEHYWQVESAKKRQVLSTFLLITVQSRQAKEFTNYWNKLRESSPKYNRYLKNCSTLCYDAFKAADLLSGVWDPVTPARLYHALVKKYSSRPEANFITQTGYLGLEQDKIPGKYKLVLGDYVF